MSQNILHKLPKFTIVIICLFTNSHCYNSYGSSEISPVKLVRGHEVVLDIPKYNIKITSTIKDDGRNGFCQHGENCNCDVCSSAQRYMAGSQQRGDTNPWTTYELVPVAGNVPNHFGYQGTYQPMSRDASNQAVSSYDPLLGSPRHKHKQNWFYSAPSWMPSDSSNMNILRSSEPRGSMSSHSHFVKVNKHSGKSIVHSHSFIKTKPTIIKPVYKKGGLSIHKNIHLHKFRNNVEDFERVASAARQVDNRYVGSHMFAAPRWRRDTEEANRKKRGVLEFVRLVGDHDAKIDVSKTAENVGAATKNVFENDKSPLYHMRNLVGSSQDALMSILSARPRGVLIPSKYRIVSADEAPIVGAINPGLYEQNGQLPPADDEDEAQDDDDAEQYADEQPQYQAANDECAGRSPTVEYDDTFSRIGAILRDSVQRAYKSAEHAADAVHSARQVVATARKYWPKILLPYVGAVEVEKKGKGSEIVGSAQDPQFVGIGRIMDYFGVTGEHPPHPPTEPRLGAPRQLSEEEQLLNNAKNSLGTATYRQFMEKMKKELGRYQRLNPKSADGEQVGSRLLPRLPMRPRPLLPRLPLRPRPLLPRIPRPVHKPLLVDPNLHRIRTALKLPPKPLPRLVKAPSPALLRLREALKPKPALRIKPRLLPKIRNPLVGAPKAEVKETPALAKLRDSLKLPPKPEVKVEKPVSPALAKLREAIAQRKAARKSPIVGKAKNKEDENEREPKTDTKPSVEIPDYIYSDEDTDKSMPEEKTPPLVGSQAKSIITSPNLDDSDEVEPNKDTTALNTKPSDIDTSSQKEPTALERLRAKLQEKEKPPASNVDNSDLLGRALEILRSRAQQKAEQASDPPLGEDVGAAQSDTSPPANSDDDVDNELGAPHDPGEMKFAAVPVPIFTKEMKTPFMGFASKKDLDEYFKNLYCSECKKNRETDES